VAVSAYRNGLALRTLSLLSKGMFLSVMDWLPVGVLYSIPYEDASKRGENGTKPVSHNILVAYHCDYDMYYTRERRANMKQKKPSQPTRDLLDMEQAIRFLKTTRPTFYRWLRAGKIRGMKVGRQWRFNREDVERFLKGEHPRIDLPVSIEPLIEVLEQRLRKSGVKSLPTRNGEPVAYAIKLMILTAAISRASDLHVASQKATDQPRGFVNVRMRVDGVLQHVTDFDLRLHAPFIEQCKMMAGCDSRETRLPQDGRIAFEMPESGADRPLDIRVNFLPSVLGEALTLRLLRTWGGFTLNQIELRSRDRERLQNVLRSQWGLVLLTGPTGSGKTTTLYGCVTQVNQSSRKIVAVENPIECILPGVVQIPVRPGLGLTFSSALRATLRSCPDVTLVGEICDRDTLDICFQLAQTGHLVLSSLHAENATSALMQLLDLGSDPFPIADATKLIVAQRLPRMLCRACSTPGLPPDEVLTHARQLAEAGGIRVESVPQEHRRLVGCDKCSQTGYRGRMVIAEVLEVTPEIAAALRRRATSTELQAIAVGQGMTTMVADGIAKAATGITTVEEVLRVCAVH
jgi:excisionase family DNA binding protein